MSGFNWNEDWKTGKSFVGSLLRETAAERDARLRRERAEQERRQREDEDREQVEFEQQLRSHRERELAEERRRQELNVQHEQLWGSSFSFRSEGESNIGSSGTQQRGPSSGRRQPRQVQDLDDVSRLAARFDHELEEQEAAELMEREADARRLRQQRESERTVAMQGQLHNPLGLHYQDHHASTPAYSQGYVAPFPTAPPAPWNGEKAQPPPPSLSAPPSSSWTTRTTGAQPPLYPPAPPSYDDTSQTAPSKASHYQQQPSSAAPAYLAPDAAPPRAPSPGTVAASKPPAYFDALDEKLKQPGVSKRHEVHELFQTHAANAPPPTFTPAATTGASARRCASCFNLIASDVARGYSGLAVQRGVSTYHLECYEKNAAPHCAFCGSTLYPHHDMNLSGMWGEYRGKKYHVECYQYHAGPRCCSCFDVIFANPAKHLSGEWRTLPDSSFIHEECYQRRITGMRTAPRL